PPVIYYSEQLFSWAFFCPVGIGADTGAKKPSLGATAGKRGCTILIQPIDASSGFHRFAHHGGQACSNFVSAPAICDKV
ncbi:hypothetical protein, partial [Aeromonas salmonicida]|uniref:hypothetical protein n=1 Tax=Aeromonas salmonicida TaxID=645 RepID=UPI001BB0FDED